MRFNRLQIPAFGPFTNLDLNFPAEGGDFHVIYGSNEAGKSSLLRAFRDLLFGIPSQSPDNFIHEYRKLRISGEIANKTGTLLTFKRRKGNRNTLLDAMGNELPDNALHPFLGSVDQEYFSTMFGLGTKELREGAEQLLQGKGDIGNALFSASMGGTPVQQVLTALTEESESLFKGRALSNVTIRPAANEYKELLRKSRESIVTAEEWEKIEKDLEAAAEAKANLEGEIAELTQKLEWLTRCEDALPTVGRLSEEMRKMDKLPKMADVSRDFVERARAARKTADEANAEVNRLTSQIARLEEQLAGCQTSPNLLSAAEDIDGLHQHLGVYQERMNSLTDLSTELAGLVEALNAGMQNLEISGDFSTLEKLRMNSAVRLACEEAANNLQKALDERDKNKEKTGTLKSQIETLEKQLENLPENDLTNLREALSLAAGATEANRTLAMSESEVKRLTRETMDSHRKLTGAPEDVDITDSLSVPTKATIRRFDEKINVINQDIKIEESKIIEEEKNIDSLKAELVRMERRGELPSELALQKAREHRDHGWSLVLAEWKGDGSKEELAPGVPLEEAFPQTIVRADNIADQLREQAEAVAQAEEKRFQIAQAEKQNKAAKGKILELQSILKACQGSWMETWHPCGIVPQTPAEMEEWREEWIKFKDLLRQLRNAKEIFQQKSNQVREAKEKLATVLSLSAEKEFTLLYDEARRRVQHGEQASGRRIEVINQIKGLRIQLEPLEQNNVRLDAAVEIATKQWTSQCEVISMTKDISPKSGLTLLQERKELLAKFDNWKEADAKSQKTKEAVRQYENDISEKAVTFGAARDTTEAQENNLWTMLTKAREAQTRHEQLSGQIKESKDTLNESQSDLANALNNLEEMVRIANIASVAELDPLLVSLELRNQSQGKITTFRDTLSGLARGQTVDDFLTRIRAEDTETLTQRKSALQTQKEEKEGDLQTVRDTLSELKSQMQKLEEAGDTAADYRQQAETCAARLKQDASRFMRLRLAVHFLQNQIERFRKENQGPLLEKSGQIFNQITQGAFSGLKADFNADDIPVLVGLRPDNSLVSIEGMSDGTRDQLYLALRLAALDRYLEQHEPMPLILDDLLITCDNARAAAILPQLATLAQRTQIFLFTHHNHLVELCRRTLGDNAFHFHNLDNNYSAIGN